MPTADNLLNDRFSYPPSDAAGRAMREIVLIQDVIWSAWKKRRSRQSTEPPSNVDIDPYLCALEQTLLAEGFEALTPSIVNALRGQYQDVVTGKPISEYPDPWTRPNFPWIEQI